MFLQALSLNEGDRSFMFWVTVHYMGLYFHLQSTKQSTPFLMCLLYKYDLIKSGIKKLNWLDEFILIKELILYWQLIVSLPKKYTDAYECFTLAPAGS